MRFLPLWPIIAYKSKGVSKIALHYFVIIAAKENLQKVAIFEIHPFRPIYLEKALCYRSNPLTLQQIDHYLWNTIKESETDRPTNDGELIPKCHPAYQATQKQQLE